MKGCILFSGNQNGQWYDNGPQNVMPVVQQNMSNVDNVLPEPPQQERPLPEPVGPGDQNGNI